MHGILSQLCIGTVRRSRCGNLLQSCRKLSVTSTYQFRQSSARRTKDEDGDSPGGIGTRNENTDDTGHRSNAKSSGVWSRYTSQRYERFNESAANIIYDFDEEQKRLEEGLDMEHQPEVMEEEILERGLTGVFDVEELVDLLLEDNALDVVAIKIPEEMKYSNYMVIASSKTSRHMSALAELVRRVYKKKKNAKDPFVVIEGKNTGWVALDLGNIALHIMDPELREMYDLETLWTVGAQYDENCQQEEEKNLLDMYNLNVPFSDGAYISQPLAGAAQNAKSPQVMEENT